jgi:hypothetical protein
MGAKGNSGRCKRQKFRLVVSRVFPKSPSFSWFASAEPLGRTWVNRRKQRSLPVRDYARGNYHTSKLLRLGSFYAGYHPCRGAKEDVEESGGAQARTGIAKAHLYTNDHDRRRIEHTSLCLTKTIGLCLSFVRNIKSLRHYDGHLAVSHLADCRCSSWRWC